MMSIQKYQEHEALTLESLRREVRKGLDQLEKGKGTDGQPFMKFLLKRLD